MGSQSLGLVFQYFFTAGAGVGAGLGIMTLGFWFIKTKVEGGKSWQRKTR